MTFLDGPHPRAFAHRGWHTGDLSGCENSLAAFRRAVAEGFHYLETDVRATADGVLMVFHDETLDRVTDAHGPIASLTFAEVERARIAGREPIPTLRELLATCPDAYVNIDPKSNDAVGPLLDVLREHDAFGRVCVTSFEAGATRAIRDASPPALTTATSPRDIRSLVLHAATNRPAAAQAAQVTQVPMRHRGIPVVSPRFVDTAHAAGLEVHVWTIDDEEQMELLLDWGVDGIMTDRPDILRTVLARRGLWA